MGNICGNPPSESTSFDKYINYGDRSANDFVNKYHTKTYKESIANPAKFWNVEAQRLHWHKPYKKIIDTSD